MKLILAALICTLPTLGHAFEVRLETKSSEYTTQGGTMHEACRTAKQSADAQVEAQCLELQGSTLMGTWEWIVDPRFGTYPMCEVTTAVSCEFFLAPAQ